jgi:hypothetical protein
MNIYVSASSEVSCGPPCVCAAALVAAKANESRKGSHERCTQCGREFRGTIVRPKPYLRVVK